MGWEDKPSLETLVGVAFALCQAWEQKRKRIADKLLLLWA